MTPTIQPLTYHCPHCHTTIEARPERAEEVVTCPSCKQAFKLELPSAMPDEAPPAGIVLPPGVEPPATPPPAATPAAPAAEPVTAAVPTTETPEGPGETIRVSMWRRYPLRCLAYAVGSAIGIALVVWLLVEGLNILALIAGAVLAYLVFRAVGWWLQMYNTTLTITDRRCIIQTGVFSRQATEFARKDITNLHISQDGLMRLLDVGDLIIHTNTGEQHEVVLMAVPHPEIVAQKIAIPPPPPQQPAVNGTPQTTGVA
jgi:hypothetical protein